LQSSGTVCYECDLIVASGNKAPVAISMVAANHEQRASFILLEKLNIPERQRFNLMLRLWAASTVLGKPNHSQRANSTVVHISAIGGAVYLESFFLESPISRSGQILVHASWWFWQFHRFGLWHHL